jgi:predicted transporter
MEWGFVLGLATITLLVIGLVIYFGRKFSKAIQDHSPESCLAVSITPTGNALAACMVGFLIVCVAARELAPEGSLGALLGTLNGVVTVLVATIFFFAIAGTILEKLGYPIIKRGGRGA